MAPGCMDVLHPPPRADYPAWIRSWSS